MLHADEPLPRYDRSLAQQLGGKGASLAVMTAQLGLPVPPAFTFTLNAFRHWRSEGSLAFGDGTARVTARFPVGVDITEASIAWCGGRIKIPELAVDLQKNRASGTVELARIELGALLRATIPRQISGEGLIAIYTKPGTGDKKTFDNKKIPGFYRPKEFIGPDYEDTTADLSRPDYRTTIYWNPDLKTEGDGETSVTFFAADLPGKYRIVVEGVTVDGTPIRCEQMIEIVER